MADHDEVLAALRGLRFLQDIATTDLEALVPLARLLDFPTGSAIFREGQSHASVFFVVEGSVALELRVSGREVRRIQTVGPGDLLGWSPALGQDEMSATAVVLAPTRVVEMSGTRLAALCDQDPHFGYEFMKRTAQALARRLNATRLRLIDASSHEPIPPDA